MNLHKVVILLSENTHLIPSKKLQ